MRIFRKMNTSTCLYKNGHNSTYDRDFFMKLAPLDSAHTELSIHAKNSIFMKYPERSLFSEQVTYYYSPCPYMYLKGIKDALCYKFRRLTIGQNCSAVCTNKGGHREASSTQMNGAKPCAFEKPA